MLSLLSRPFVSRVDPKEAIGLNPTKKATPHVVQIKGNFTIWEKLKTQQQTRFSEDTDNGWKVSKKGFEGRKKTSSWIR